MLKNKVYELAKKIPKGKVTTYKIIAEALSTKAYRAVGTALNKNHDKRIPCHRIVNSNGMIGGYNKGSKAKARILRKEGIVVKDGKIKDFKGKDSHLLNIKNSCYEQFIAYFHQQNRKVFKGLIII